jgi:hypothetical protein
MEDSGNTGTVNQRKKASVKQAFVEWKTVWKRQGIYHAQYLHMIRGSKGNPFRIPL